MKKAIIAVMIGCILGIGSTLGVQQFMILSARVTNIERFLTNAMKQVQPQKPPEKVNAE